MDSQHLLVPIKVQALVVDDLVITKKGAIEIAPDTYAANDGRWSPQLFDYEVLPASLSGPGPTPFYGATRTYNGNPAEQLQDQPLSIDDGGIALFGLDYANLWSNR